MHSLTLFLAGGLAIAPALLHAQNAVLEGTVREGSTASPIDAAVVTLEFAPPIGQNGIVEQVPAERQLHLMISTTSGGGFVFPAVFPGTYVLSTRRIGYAPLETLIELTPGTHRVQLTLDPVRVQLAPVEITAASRLQQHLDDVGFLHRRKEGFGKFMDAAEIGRTHPFDVMSLFRPIIEGCTMIFIDGMPRSLRDITLDQIAGFEYYARRVMTPAEFVNPRVDCGSLVVWTWIKTS
ncbi:MAG TPA: carboxypeptidase-like regulatory domain-containing protein [Gemmatimonadaceae bacterium]|nr:carboxypeptidase-like regulatory domain-containing protein [Gemmatimonadaceae bacterium]